MLTAAEQQQLLTDFNNSAVPYPEGSNILDLLKDRVSENPGGISVVFEGACINYQELDERSNRLAHYLIASCAPEEMSIPVFLPRGLSLIVAIIGVLKAGFAYVPIDPGLPQERVAGIIDTLGASWVITDSNGKSVLLSSSATVIDLEALNNEVAAHPAVATGVNITPQHLAYIIYTSGSTGQPKGVMIEHGNLYNAAMSWRHQYGLHREAPVVLSLASISFDVFTGDLCRALLNGGTLVMMEDVKKLDLACVCKEIITHGVTMLESTPAMILHLIRYARSEMLLLSSLKILIVGSDSISVADYKYLFDYCLERKIKLINSYGLTETTIDACFFDGEPDGLAAVPIGKPMHNMTCYILDEWHNPVPIGITGELYIGGAGVGRGYINDTLLTAQKYITCNGIFNVPERLYRTGDKASWLPDGNILFHGRLDDQIKIRGYRIEPGEIEYALQQSKHVKQALVVTAVDHAGNDRLIAYIVPGIKFVAAEVNNFLRERLPGYMIPSVLVTIPRLPLTANNKVDRKLLPPVHKNEFLSDAYVAPGNEIQAELAAVWKELLKIEAPGIYDNFFALGGHSILIQAMLSSYRKKGFDVQLRDLFIHQTISAQDMLIRKQREENRIAIRSDNDISQKKNRHVLLLNKGERPLNIFIIPGIGGKCEGYYELANAFGADYNVYGLQMQGIYHNEKPLNSIAAIARKNIEWISRIQPVGPYRLVGHSFGGLLAFEMTRQLEARGEQVDFTAILDTRARLSSELSNGRTVRDLALELVGGYLESFRFITKPFPTWTRWLQKKISAMDLHEIPDYLHYYLPKKINTRRRILKLVIRLINLRLHNDLMEYTPSTKINGSLILFRALKGREAVADESYGWSPYSHDVRIVTMPGNHDMTNNENSSVVAAYLKNM
jgi:amino acid adenylation domain-containing protein